MDNIEAAKYIVDNLLPYDVYAKTFYFVSFEVGTTQMMIVQKTDTGYAAFILFGYNIKNIVYRTKTNGVWSS